MKEKFGISAKMSMFEELKEKFISSPNFIITNYKGLSSLEIEKLRKDLVKSSSKYFVVKNSILKRVFDQLNLGDLKAFIKGEIGVGFTSDIMGASKTFVNFSKDRPSFTLSCAMIDGKVEGADKIRHLAMLPPREVLLGLALNYMKSPITSFVGVLNGLFRNLVYVINEIKNKRGDTQ